MSCRATMPGFCAGPGLRAAFERTGRERHRPDRGSTGYFGRQPWLLCGYFLSILMEKSPKATKRTKAHFVESQEFKNHPVNPGQNRCFPLEIRGGARDRT